MIVTPQGVTKTVWIALEYQRFIIKAKQNNGTVCFCKWNDMFSFPKGSQTLPTNMPPPRKLPQRSWAASIPTILTHSALNILLLPSPTPGLVPGLAGSYLCSPLERFLGSVIMRRHLQRIIQQETVWVLVNSLVVIVGGGCYVGPRSDIWTKMMFPHFC